MGDGGSGECACLVGRRPRWGSPLGARPDRRRPEAGGIGVETENYLTAALFDERREPVGKWLPGAEARVSCGVQPLTAFLSAEPALNRGTLLAAISIRSPVWGLTP